ncbi:MAG: histidine kinase N-terminal 7TM domain-containing protein [Patescibacteria group bacterium]
METLNLVIIILSVISSIILGILVLRKNFKSATNQIFAFFCFITSFWALLTYYSILGYSENISLIIIRSVMALAIIQTISFFLFVHTFPSNKIILNKKYLYLLLITGLIGIFICFSSLLFPSIEIENGKIIPNIGLGIIYFIILSMGSVFSGIILLFKKYKKSSGIEKKQFSYILLGLVGMFSLIIVFNFLFVVLFKISNFIIYGPAFVLLFIIPTAYAITRYRLFGIRFIFKKAFSYFIGLIIITIFYGFILFIFQKILVQNYNWNATLVHLLTLLIIIISIEPLRNSTVKLINKLFYPKKIERIEHKKDFNKKLASTKDFNILVAELLKSYLNFIPSDKIKLYLPDQKTQSFIFSFPEKGKFNFQDEKALFNYLNNNPDVLLTQEIPYLIEELKANNQLNSLKEDLVKNNIALAVPIGEKNEIMGVFFIINKDKKAPYNKEEVDLINEFKLNCSPLLISVVMYKMGVEGTKQ